MFWNTFVCPPKKEYKTRIKQENTKHTGIPYYYHPRPPPLTAVAFVVTPLPSKANAVVIHCRPPLLLPLLSAAVTAVTANHCHGVPSSLECNNCGCLGCCRWSHRRIHFVRLFYNSFLVEDYNDQLRLFTGPLLVFLSEHHANRLCTYFLIWYNAMTKLCLHIDCEDKVVSFNRERGLQDPNNVIGLTLASIMPYAVPFRSVRVYLPSGFMDSMMDPCAVWDVQGNLASNNALGSLNYSVACLCHNPDAYDNVHHRPGCNARTGVPVLNGVGLGIIRSNNQLHRNSLC